MPLVESSGQKSSDTLNSLEYNCTDTNTSIILSGENLLYRVKLFSPQNLLSQIVYVILIDENKKIWFHHKVKVNKQGIGVGNFTIPTEAKTRNYKLISYTLSSENKGKNSFFSKDILIINPFFPLEQAKLSTVSGNAFRLNLKPPATQIVLENSPINLGINAQIFSPREKVQLKINIKTAHFDGNYLVSVRQLPEAQTTKKVPATFVDPEPTFRTYPKELKGEIISGTISPNITSKQSPLLVSLTIPGRDYLFKITSTQEDGRFSFLIDQPYSTAESTLQVLESPQEYTITLDKTIPHLPETINFKNVILNPALKDWITQQSIDLQIENAYKEIQEENPEDSIQQPPFYHPFATRYILEDFTLFKSMHETFIEVIKTAAMRLDPEGTRLLVYNEKQVTSDALDRLDPLVLIDGIQIQDFSLVANLNPARVNYIDVVAQQYRYGPKIFSGIIALSTKKNDFKLPENSPNTLNFELKSPEKNNEFRVKNSRNPTISSRIPDYRTQLYWDPYLKITNEPQEITFYTSDKEGLFEICITGYKASGEKIEVKKTFRVKAGK